MNNRCALRVVGFTLILFSFFSFPLRAAVPYACPMKCEGEKTYEKPGQCPICKMDLEPVAAITAPQTPPEIRIDVDAKPVHLVPKTNAQLHLTFRRTKDDSILKDFETVHEKKVHLVAVSADLNWFSHVHPVQQTDGSFLVDLNFPNSGSYVLYADTTPTGMSPQIIPVILQIDGAAPDAVPLKVDGPGKHRVGAYSVVMKWEPSREAGADKKRGWFEFSVTKGKKPVRFESYLGAAGHCVMISKDTTRFVHNHPASHGAGHHEHSTGESSGKIIFDTTVPKAGLYKVWLEFKHGGIVQAAPFVVMLP